MKEFFENEMQDFAASASEFARAYPEQAALLNLESLTDRDPYVERLFEGMAFLTAGIRKRLDQGVPELASQLLQQMAPSLEQTYPSSCVIEFTLPDDAATPVIVNKGQRVTARNLGPDQIACHFTTVHEQVVQPLHITDVKRTEAKGSHSQLEIRIEKTNLQAWQDLNLKRLPVYLNSDRALVYRLWQLLTDDKTHCSLYQKDTAISFPVRFVPQPLASLHGMLPETGRDIAAYSLPLDYFCGRDLFFYVEIEGLDQVVWCDETSHFTISVESELKLPATHSVEASQLVLNTVPAINLFTGDAEPVRFDHTRAEYTLYPDTAFFGQMEIYSVNRVIGRNLHNGFERQYQPLYAQHYHKNQDSVFYTIHDRQPSGQSVSRLVLHQTGQPVSEIISVEVTATNGYYARQYLGLNSLQEVRVDSCPGLKVANITRPSQPRKPFKIDNPEWRWIATLASSISHLNDQKQLQHILGLCDWTGDLANRKRIESLVSFSKVLQHRIYRGALYRQWLVEITLHEEGFDSEGDAELFGFMLHQLLTALAPLGELVETHLTLLPDYKEKQWKPVL